MLSNSLFSCQVSVLLRRSHFEVFPWICLSCAKLGALLATFTRLSLLSTRCKSCQACEAMPCLTLPVFTAVCRLTSICRGVLTLKHPDGYAFPVQNLLFIATCIELLRRLSLLSMKCKSRQTWEVMPCLRAPVFTATSVDTTASTL